MHDAPLVVLRDDFLRVGKNITRERRGGERLHDLIVECQHRAMELRHNCVPA
jgi:hypothetical protein